SFRFPEWADLWTPLAWSAKDRALRGEHNYRVVARLRPDATLPQARAEVDAISRRLEREYPGGDKGWRALREPRVDPVGGAVRPDVRKLFAAVGLVLLIACANVANLVLARTLARRKEIALRAALGAGRGRVLLQVLCENLLLALAGGALGLLVAHNAVEAIVGFVGDRLPRAAEIRVDGGALVFTLLISVVTGLAAGLVPALRLMNVNLSDALKQGTGRTAADTGGNRTRAALAVAEVAVAM